MNDEQTGCLHPLYTAHSHEGNLDHFDLMSIRSQTQQLLLQEGLHILALTFWNRYC